ncbi:MAG: glycosyltransferase [Bacilli bacterium]|nr:glycosyltransferase [Bacilli bacterium]
MNVAIFSDTYLPDVNGVATSCNTLFKILRKFGHTVYVVCPGETFEFNDNILRIPGLELKSLYDYRLSFIWDENGFQILKNLKLDLVHVNTDFGVGQFGMSVANRLNIPIVFTYNTMYEDYTYYFLKGFLDRFSKWTIREFEKSSMNRASEIISPSLKTMKYLRSVGVEKYINIVPTGFDFERFEKNEEHLNQVADLREKLGFKKDDFIALCLGRIAHEKSYDIILYGFKKYLDTYRTKNTYLLVVGDGPDKQELEKLATELEINDYVKFLGKVDNGEVPKYYWISNVFLNSSISETQGLTFMEAMASSIPILCRFDNSLVGVINNKRTGFFYIDEEDFPEKLEFVKNLTNEKKGEICKAAIKSIDNFSEKNFYHKILEVYNRAIRKSW